MWCRFDVVVLALVCCRVALARCWCGGGLVWVVLCIVGEVLVWSDVVWRGVAWYGGRGVLCYLAGCVRGNGLTRGPRSRCQQARASWVF